MPPPGFRPSPEVAARRARVLQLRIEQRPYAEIAATLGIPASTAEKDYQRALEAYAAGQRANAHVAVDRELAKLDQLEQAVYEVLRRRHITVQHGKIVRDDHGAVVEDDAPVLAATDRLVRIAARRATLTGMDAPARIEVSDATDQAIRALAAELAAGLGELEPGGETAAAGDAAGSEVSTPAP